jgi:hypothetical protein
VEEERNDGQEVEKYPSDKRNQHIEQNPRQEENQKTMREQEELETLQRGKHGKGIITCCCTKNGAVLAVR